MIWILMLTRLSVQKIYLPLTHHLMKEWWILQLSVNWRVPSIYLYHLLLSRLYRGKHVLHTNITRSPELSQVCAISPTVKSWCWTQSTCKCETWKDNIPSILLRVKMLMYVRKYALMLVPNTFTLSAVIHHRTIFVFSVCRSHRSDCVFCRYIETLTPILTNLHPSHIVDQLHDKVSSDVQDQNKIKKQQAKQVRFKQGTVGIVGCKGFYCWWFEVQ